MTNDDKEELERKSGELAEQREWFRVTLSSIGDAVITTDTDSRITFLNPIAEALTGWKLADAKGQPLETIFKIINEESRQPVDNPIERALREGIIVGLANHTALISRDGKETAVEDSAAPILDGSGNIVGAVMVFHDVTDRRRAERALRQTETRLSLAMEAAQMGTWEWTIPSGKMTWSPTLEAIHGLPAAGFGGTFEDFQKTIHPDDSDRVISNLRKSVERCEDYRYEYRIVKPDGALAWVEARGKVFMDSARSVGSVAGICMDVTERKQIEAVRARLAAVVEFSDDAIISKTLAGIITTWNAGAERVFGYTASEIIGKSVTILIPHDRADEELRIISSLQRGEVIAPYETIRVRKDGTLLNVSLTVSPIKDGSGIVIGASKIARDITERRQAEVERARLTSVLEKTLEDRERLLSLEQAARAKAEEAENRARFLAEASGRLVSSLDYEAALADVARAAVPGIADWCSVHLLDRGGAPRIIAIAHPDPAKLAIAAELRERYPAPSNSPMGMASVLRTGQSQVHSHISDEMLVAAARDAAHLTLLRSLDLSSVIIVPLIAGGKTLGAITLVSAESGRHFSAGDLPFAEDLAARAAAAAENARLYQELRHANAAKDHFIAVLSHELRTPLNPVLMTVTDLERDETVPSAIREQLAVVRRNVELEARLIDDLLDSTRISSGKLQLHRVVVDANELTQRAVAIVLGDAREKGVSLDATICARPCPVDADPARLQQVIWNVVKNGVKFTPEGGWVRVSCAIESGDRVRLTIADNGIGIDSKHLDKIFNAFEQGDARTGHRFGGLGLGLAISKALVTLHGGSLTVQSEGRGHGSTFIIELPLAIQPSISALLAPAPVPARQALRLLVVEDHEATSHVMVRLLTKRGYAVSAASSIRQALTILTQEPIDILISDVGLPDGSGRELMEKIRETRMLPGIALSGYGTEADLAQSSAVGFSVHLTKPVDIDRLDQEIQLLGLRSESSS